MGEKEGVGGERGVRGGGMEEWMSLLPMLKQVLLVSPPSPLSPPPSSTFFHSLLLPSPPPPSSSSSLLPHSDWYESDAVMMCEEGSVIAGLLMGLNAIDYNVMMKGEDFDKSVSY